MLKNSERDLRKKNESVKLVDHSITDHNIYLCVERELEGRRVCLQDEAPLLIELKWEWKKITTRSGARSGINSLVYTLLVFEV